MNPCPQCGAPLRWIPEAGLWNCDRCGNRVAPNAAPPTPPPGNYPPQMQQGGPQQGYAPQQHGYPPQQGYPPQGYGHYPHPGAGRSKGKLVAIIAAVGALAAGGIVLAVVLSKKSSGDGGGGGGGFESAEALAKATLEALVAGDPDKLASFMPTVEMGEAAMDCPAEVKEKNAADTRKGFEEMKKRLADAAGKMKGSGATFKKVNTDIAKQETPAGGQLGDCKAKVAITFTGVGIEHDFVNPSDKSKQDHKTTYGVMILDGKYYLLDPGEVPEALGGAGGETPTTPDTPTTPPPDTPLDVNTAIAELEQMKSAACSCTDKACADDVAAKLMAAAQKYADVPAATPADTDRIKALASDVATCVKKFADTPTTPPDTPTTPTEPGQGLPECEAYAKAAERFIKCSKVPKQSRDAVQTAVDTMRKNWGDPSKMSDDMKRSAAETCTTLEKSMKDAAAAIGCK